MSNATETEGAGRIGDDAPFLASPGTVDRIDQATTKIPLENSFGAVSKVVDGKTVMDKDAFNAGVVQLIGIVESIENALASGAKVKTINASGEIVEKQSTPTRPESEIIELVRKFLTPPGPVFISDPIDGYVYVGRTPRVMDRIDADTASAKQGGDETIRNFSLQFSLVLNCLLGRIHESKVTEIGLIRAMSSDIQKWHSLLEAPPDQRGGRDPHAHVIAAVMGDTNPEAMDWTVRPLLNSWWEWYMAVTPTGAELKKYRALAGSATSS